MHDEATLNSLKKVEDRLEQLEKAMHEKDVAAAITEQQIQGLKQDFADLKCDVLTALKLQNERTFGLIEKGIKIIIGLIVFIMLLSGVKIMPELLKLLGGI